MFPWVPKEIGAQAEILGAQRLLLEGRPRPASSCPTSTACCQRPTRIGRCSTSRRSPGGGLGHRPDHLRVAARLQGDEDRGNYKITLVPGVDVAVRSASTPPTRMRSTAPVERRALPARHVGSLDRDELNEVYFLGLGRPTRPPSTPTRATTSRSGSTCGPPTIPTWPTSCSNEIGPRRPRPRRLPDLPGRLQPDHSGRRPHRRLGDHQQAVRDRDRAVGRHRAAVTPRLVDNAAWTENIAPTSSCCSGHHRRHHRVLELINDGVGSGGVGLHGDFNMAGSYDVWETARVAIERGERKLEDSAASCPAPSRPRSGSATSSGSGQFGRSEFGSDEWVELAQKMYDWTGDNVFVIGTVGVAPRSCSPARTCATSRPSSRSPNTDWKGNLMYWADQLWFDRE